MDHTNDPALAFAEFGQATAQPLSKIQQVVARRMAHNWTSIPHVTHHDDLDVTAIEEDRAAAGDGERITPLAYLFRATASAMRALPRFNTSLSEDGKMLVFKDYVHIGMAIDVEGGLVVAVIRDCDRKSLREIATEIRDLATTAREKGLPYDRMVGGCITISSLGGLGGTGFTPIINAPEVAIIGVSSIRTQPVWDGTGFVPRSMMPVSLSYDHRVINGADAARFCRFMAGKLATPHDL